MEPISQETIDQATQKMRQELSYEKLILKPKYKNLTKEKHEQMLNFVESMCLILLNSYLGSDNDLDNNE